MGFVDCFKSLVMLGIFSVVIHFERDTLKCGINIYISKLPIIILLIVFHQQSLLQIWNVNMVEKC